ncbi:MAG: hypothetical protein IPK60_19580 [Sandaracinaceae bacterium]|nr:hypothetical protein [Sandaracinaceae bacterium]
MSIALAQTPGGEAGSDPSVDGDPLYDATQVLSVSHAVDLSITDGVSCAVLGDGSVSCWGYQVESGAGSYVAVPQSALGFTDAVQVATGSNAVCVRRAPPGGELWCWGDSRMLGTGDASDVAGPRACPDSVQSHLSALARRSTPAQRSRRASSALLLGPERRWAAWFRQRFFAALFTRRRVWSAMTLSFRLLLALLVFAMGWSAKGVLTVSVQTSLVPGRQSDLVDVPIVDSNPVTEGVAILRHGDVRAVFEDDYLHGKRVAEFSDIAAGETVVRVRLMQPDGLRLLERRVRVTIAEGGASFSLVVRMSRDCLDVTCPNASGGCT